VVQLRAQKGRHRRELGNKFVGWDPLPTYPLVAVNMNMTAVCIWSSGQYGIEAVVSSYLQCDHPTYVTRTKRYVIPHIQDSH